MTARRSKSSFASLLRRAPSLEEAEPPVARDAQGAFRVDPVRVRLWSGLSGPTPAECRDRIGAIVREGQVEPVTVRPVFDDAHYEYEVVSGARDYVAVRHLRDTAMPRLELLVRVELVDDDDGVGQLAADCAPPARYPRGAIAVAGEGTPPTEPLSLGIVDASAGGVTFRLDAASDLLPEMLARIVKAMIDGAAADGIAVNWRSDQ